MAQTTTLLSSQSPGTIDESQTSTPPTAILTGEEVRQLSRGYHYTKPTSGLAPTHLQANLIILPSRYANDFRLLCARNPVPCPLVAESSSTGEWDSVKSHLPGLEGHQILQDCDIRLDVPRYMVYRDSKLESFHCLDIVDHWTDDHVAFLIGCSFSFETALSSAGLVPRHIVTETTIPMYRTKVPLCPAGVFTNGTYVVSMRQYKASEVEEVRNITRRYTSTHGEPIAWGWDAVKSLGIEDIDRPEWGDAPKTWDGQALGQIEGSQEEIPVFWGCGVTPQEAVMKAGLAGVVMAHAPGHMLVLDCRDSDIVQGNDI